MVYEDLRDDEARELSLLVKRYLGGDADMEQLPTDSLKRIRETYKAARSVYQATMAELRGQAEQHRASLSSIGGPRQVGQPPEKERCQWA